jgi:hypothetical protein
VSLFFIRFFCFKMKTFAAILAAAAISAVVAECPNGCSGHGKCGSKDACTCFDNWMGGDCSQRVCPFGLAFVDTPLGDLNHDGMVDSSSVGVQWANKDVNEVWQGSNDNEAHFYTECSGKGVCNRGSGECECYDGFTGSSCQRTTCPNDCSGHGQCYTLREIANGANVPSTHDGNNVGRNFRIEDFQYGVYTTSGVSKTFDYNLWDADKNQACVCDSGYFGPDCGMRDCPRGNDPLTNDRKHCNDETCTSELQQFWVHMDASAPAGATTCMFLEWEDKEDNSGLINAMRSHTFCVKPGLTGDDYADLVQDAIDSFPNGALNGVSVTCEGMHSGGADLEDHVKCSTAATTGDDVVVLNMDFTSGPQGDVNDITPYIVSQDGSKAVTLGAGGNAVSVSVYADGSAIDLALHPTQAAMTGTTLAAGAALDVGAVFTGASALEAFENGNQENSPCSNRGICNYSTGECHCFAGYTREDCSEQSALSM